MAWPDTSSDTSGLLLERDLLARNRKNLISATPDFNSSGPDSFGLHCRWPAWKQLWHWRFAVGKGLLARNRKKIFQQSATIFPCGQTSLSRGYKPVKRTTTNRTNSHEMNFYQNRTWGDLHYWKTKCPWACRPVRIKKDNSVLLTP